MTEFLVFFLTVSSFAFNAFCMDPSRWKPTAPDNVEFGECLFVRDIIGGPFSSVFYSYRHICREKFPDGSQQPDHEKNWYIVGRLTNFGTETPTTPQYDYRPIKQSLIKFVLMTNTTIEFILLEFANRKIHIEFQSVQQRNAFYALVYDGVNLKEAASKKISLVHEITDTGVVKVGSNVEALQERLNYIRYITFKNDDGQPLFIASQHQVALMQVNRRRVDKLQLLLRAHTKYYILTFTSCDEAKEISDDLLRYVKILQLGHVDDHNVANCFYDNEILRNNLVP